MKGHLIHTAYHRDSNPDETKEWIESIEDVIQRVGPERANYLLQRLAVRSRQMGVNAAYPTSTPYINTIHVADQGSFPGDRDIEVRIENLIRWNAMAMVVRANRRDDGLGGHISTFASAATLYEVGFNHFFRGRGPGGFDGDLIYFQGHSSPGIYSRAFLNGRLQVGDLERFRRELSPEGGLSSYPHPWLMPNFWEFPTVSMGLGPIAAIYQARFNRYLRHRGLLDTSNRHVWAFLGDGETDEPETLGAISLAAREKLNNLIFVVNCNLQRLDGPVRGNGKIIQELETVFAGAGWNVIKVLWSEDWDPILERDYSGKLLQRMEEALDGEYQKYSVESGRYIRDHFFGKYPETAELAQGLSDGDILDLRRGGHDPAKVYAAYQAAVNHEGGPTVILAKTVKGYGLGEVGEGRNVTHSQKKLNFEELRLFRDRFQIPISDKDLEDAPFYRPEENSPEIQYLRERRANLGGPVPSRRVLIQGLDTPPLEEFSTYLQGVDRAVSTTMVFVQMLRQLLKHKTLGEKIVPIVPDEARTFGMESLFRQHGIYSSVGQLYEPVDSEMLLYYHEKHDGQILEEGITEAGSMASFTAAGTAYANHGIDMIPFYIYYSMFGFQRTGDQAWAFGDMRGRGFVLGATSGRTTLLGEGLQHQDGHSHLLASVIPNLKAYDPAFGYELAVIIQDGMQRMYQDREDIFYYITLTNENYPMPPMPEGTRDGILRGLYRYRTSDGFMPRARAQIFGSGSILLEALRAQEILRDRYSVAADVWSATSYTELRREALDAERYSLLHPKDARKPWLAKTLQSVPGPFIAVSDYLKSVPDQIARWVPGGLFTLGTDGFGRSDTREQLRRFFEIDGEFIAYSTLYRLALRGEFSMESLPQIAQSLGIDPTKANPALS